MLSTSELMKQGKFELAYQRLTDAMSANPATSSRHLYNRGLCLLNLGRLMDALADFNDFIREVPDTDAGYIAAGTTLWCLERPTEAIQTWTSSLETAYTDAAGGVEIPGLLFFAGVRLANSDIERKAVGLLRQRLRSVRSSAWPGPIAQFILGDLDENALLTKARQKTSTRHRAIAKACFWVAVSYYRREDTAKYQHWLARAASGHILEPEYYLARCELGRAPARFDYVASP